MRLDSQYVKVPIYSEPIPKGIITGYLKPGTTVEVKESKGFYELTDGTVSCFYVSICLNQIYFLSLLTF